jgi:hypothetical protein
VDLAQICGSCEGALASNGARIRAFAGSRSARAETEPVIFTNVFGGYQVYRYLHPWPSGARARELNAEAPLPPALPCRSYGFLEVTTEGYRRLFQVGGCES